MTDGNDRTLVRYENVICDSGRWEGFALRPDDIIISTPPKCGTTWTQMLIALLVFQTPDLPAPLAQLSPWLDMRTRARADVVANLDAQHHRRFIKTHTPLAGLPLVGGVTYVTVGRDPRDVALSMGDHIANLDFVALLAASAAAAEVDGVPMLAVPAPPPEDLDQSDRAKFWRWVLDDAPVTSGMSSLLVTMTHVQSFWDVRDSVNVVVLHYADLKADLEGQMRALAGRLGIVVPEARWPALVEAASFASMKGNAETTVPNSDTAIWRETADFFRKGRSGAWREVLETADDRQRYDDRVATLAPPDLSAWMHRS